MQRRVMVKYGDEVIERPSIASKLEYRGYQVMFEKVADGYNICYNPELPEKLNRMFDKCKDPEECEKMAKNAIDLVHEIEVQASGQAAQAGEIGNGPHSGPLERNNG